MILGGSKMKLMNLIKIAPMVLMVFALSTQARGDEHMRKGITRQIEPMEAVLDYPVVKILVKSPCITLNMDPILIPLNNLEDWMFNEEYLASEESPELVEAWMMEPGYLGDDSQPVEDWMLEVSYLDQSSDSSLESWMMDLGYLAQ